MKSTIKHRKIFLKSQIVNLNIFSYIKKQFLSIYLFLCLKISMTTIATIVLMNVHEIYEQIKVDYPDYSVRFLYFLAACLYLDPNINLEIVLKLRPNGSLIGIDNSSLDTYLRSYKLLQLHAILHDASGFIAEHSQKGPGYSYVLPCPITNAYIGHMTGLLFCLFVKMFKKNLFNLLECWILKLLS